MGERRARARGIELAVGERSERAKRASERGGRWAGEVTCRL